MILILRRSKGLLRRRMKGGEVKNRCRCEYISPLVGTFPIGHAIFAFLPANSNSTSSSYNFYQDSTLIAHHYQIPISSKVLSPALDPQKITLFLSRPVARLPRFYCKDGEYVFPARLKGEHLIGMLQAVD